MNFIEKLSRAWCESNSLLCIGIDPDPDRIPVHLMRSRRPFHNFARGIIDATHDLVCAYKFQLAYYNAAGREMELEKSISYLQKTYPHIPIILDAKRADIACSARQYAMEAFERYSADAVTVNPYMGLDAVQPFLNYRNKGTIILCKTSNPGAGDFQNLTLDGVTLSEIVARRVASDWNTFNNCLLVVGGTSPTALATLRKQLPKIPFLVPGVGAQGANLKAVLRAGLTGLGNGLIISSSRNIIYAGTGKSFATDARSEAASLRGNINSIRATLSAS